VNRRKITMSHISIAFFGEFRPLHIEAADLKTCRAEFLKRCACPEISSRFDSVWKDFNKQRKSGISIESACMECSRFSVRLADYPRDRWIDSILAEMPLHPELDYSPLNN